MTGRYFQGIQWCDSPPTNGQDADTVLTRKPTDQTATWDLAYAIGTFSSYEPFCRQIDVYDGPLGQGYVVCDRITLDGIVNERCQNTGPETWRTKPWTVVPTP